MNQIEQGSVFGRHAVLAAGTLAEADLEPVKLRPEAEAVARNFSSRPISPRMLSGLVRFADFLAIAIIGFLVHQIHVAPQIRLDGWYLTSLALVPALTVVVLQGLSGYAVPSLRGVVTQFGRILAAWTIVFAGFAVVLFLLKSGDQFSRFWFGTWYLSGLLYFAAFRPALAREVRRWTREGQLTRRAVIVGGGQPAAELITSLERQPENDIAICGIFDDRSDDRSPQMVAGYPKLGTIAELVTFCRQAKINMLIVSLPLSAEHRVLTLLKRLWVLPVDIRISAQSNKLRFRTRSYSYVGTVPFLDVFDRPIADWDSILKRAFDLVVGTILLVLLSPLMLLTVLAIKLDSKGPVLFRQKRYGFNNQVIEVLKFRSMFHEMADPAAKTVVTRNDPRVTRVGRFIRRTSIDELPQLFNVLRGDLSLVGPRPHAVNAHTSNQRFERVVDDYFARHRVKPGLTGWAQINGWRGEIDAAEKIQRRTECDLYYIEHWSVLLDLYIVLATPFSLVAKRDNAY